MKKILPTLLMVALSALPCIANGSLRLHLTDGSEIVCNLDKEPQMSFGDNTLVLTSLDGSVGEWNFTNVDSWTFDAAQGIEAVKQNSELIRIEDGRVEVAGVAASDIAVYDISGKMVAATKESAGEVTRINLNGLAKGTYVIKIGKRSIKFMVN